MTDTLPYLQDENRLSALRGLTLLDTPIEERFERITRMVCRVLDVPIALFNLIDEDRQYYKSAQGLNATTASFEGAFCTHAVAKDEMLLVPDAKQDSRFHNSPFVTGEVGVGFYAGCPVRTPNGEPIGTLCAIDTKPRDMTAEQMAALRDLAAMVETELKVKSLSQAQVKLMEEISTANRLAMIDPLTRLWNRNGINDLLEREYSEAARQGKNVTLVMADIDHFKRINDTFGHPAGDEVLRQVGKRLLEALRGEDAVGRIGGEEFLIILTDCAPAKIRKTVERIRQDVCRKAVTIDGTAHEVTMSFGAATYRPSMTDASAVAIATQIKRADDALYRAKKNGRNRVEIDETGVQPEG